MQVLLKSSTSRINFGPDLDEDEDEVGINFD
jgi:hypothetical protein